MFTPKEGATVASGAESTEKRRVKVEFGVGIGGIEPEQTRVYGINVRRHVNDVELRSMPGSREVHVEGVRSVQWKS